MGISYRPSPEPLLGIRRIDGAYRLVVVYEELEATHRERCDRPRAWALASRLAAELSAGRELVLDDWDLAPVDALAATEEWLVGSTLLDPECRCLEDRAVAADAIRAVEELDG